MAGSVPATLASELADRYRIERELGQGGMATVYLARDVRHDRAVALKVLRPELAAVLGAERFLAEIRTTANLQHPHILPLHESGEAGGLLYYIMPYVEGESLRARLTREKQLGLEDALAITRQVAGALDYAHRRGVIHRDIKPENILLSDGNAMLADFGIALAVRHAAGERLTESGLAVGTPQYMSPEQATGERELDARSDIYSLGAVLYEMLVGEPPHTGPTVQAVVAKLLTERPVRVRVLRDTVPEVVDAAVARALSKVPADRFASASEFARELTAGPARLTLSGSTRPPWKTVGWIAASLIVVAAGLVLGARLRERGPPRGTDPRQSLLIGLFDNTRREPSLEWLRLGGVELFSRSLARWQDLDVVPPERLLDLTRRAGLSETAPMTRADALRLAREAGVWTASVGSILPEGDSLRITLRLYDVATGRQLRQVTVAAGDSAVPAAFASLAAEVFDLAGVPDAVLINADPPTRSIVAWKAYVRGLWHFAHLSGDSALALFQQARLADPRFALAYQLEALQHWARRGPFATDPMTVALADSAWKYSAERPDKERLYIQAFWHLIHGRVAQARAEYAELVSRDSSRADAWFWAGTAARNDFTLRAGIGGRQIFPADPTFALRAFRRVIALDRNYAAAYFALTLMLSPLADSGTLTVPAFRDQPSTFYTLSPRDTVRRYRWLLIHDSVAVWPVDSFVATPAQVEASRKAAQTELHDVVDRWLSVVPDASAASWWWARTAERERRWDDALTAYARAERLSHSALTAYDRLGVLLGAHRLPEAARLADSLPADSAVFRNSGRGFWHAVTVVANAWIAGGRMQEALALRRQQDVVAKRVFLWSEEITRYRAALDTLRRMGPVLWAERAAPADLPRVDARFRHTLARTPDSLKASLRRSAFPIFGLLTAQLGDTASLRRWRLEAEEPERFPGLDAWARAKAGDRAGAQRVLSGMNRDNSPPWLGNWYAAGRAAELLENAQQALHFYAMTDTSSLALGDLTADWLLLVRSWKARADVHRTIGDTAQARLYYGRVVDAWSRPDSLLVPERNEAVRRLAELERADRPTSR